MSRKALTAVVGIVVLVACSSDRPDVSRKEVADLITSADAFRQPWDPAIRIDGGAIQWNPAWKRELVAVRSVAVRGGPVSSTADARFDWRWNAGPFSGPIFSSNVRIRHVGRQWRLQDSELANALRSQERVGE